MAQEKSSFNSRGFSLIEVVVAMEKPAVDMDDASPEPAPVTLRSV